MNALHEEDFESHFLLPSELFVNKKRFQVQTVLGSCVSVCLYDQRLNIGGINHYMVPLWNGDGLASPKYGNIAIESLVQKLSDLGSMQKDWIAKIFGGANQFDNQNRIIGVGLRNIQIAETMLASFRIPTVAKSVGGEQGRKIVFDTFTGQVMMKYLLRNGGKPNS